MRSRNIYIKLIKDVENRTTQDVNTVKHTDNHSDIDRESVMIIAYYRLSFIYRLKSLNPILLYFIAQ